MALVAVFAPLIGFLLVSFFGRYLGDKTSAILTTALTGTACVCAWLLFPGVAFESQIHDITLLRWIDVGSFQVNWGIYLDTLCLVMVCVVTTVSSIVHLYSIGYMEHDKGLARFMSYLSLFTFMMLMLDITKPETGIFWLGRGGACVLPFDWVLVSQAVCQCRRHQGLCC
jgi:NADH-quinone oxidoreductase subunit L